MRSASRPIWPATTSDAPWDLFTHGRLGPDESADYDVAVMDDFTYGEPQSGQPQSGN